MSTIIKNMTKNVSTTLHFIPSLEWVYRLRAYSHADAQLFF